MLLILPWRSCTGQPGGCGGERGPVLGAPRPPGGWRRPRRGDRHRWTVLAARAAASGQVEAELGDRVTAVVGAVRGTTGICGRGENGGVQGRGGGTCGGFVVAGPTGAGSGAPVVFGPAVADGAAVVVGAAV